MTRTLLAAILLAVSLPACAGGPHGHGYSYRKPPHHHGHWRHHHGRGWQWVVPAIVGGAVVYTVIKSQEQPPQQPPVIIERQTVEPNCSPWTEIENEDGTITRTRTCRK